MIRGLVFDLDDTLADERDYVRSGFAHVARTAAASPAEEERLFAWLRDAFERGVRGDTFDRLLAAFPDVAARVTRDDLVTAYREHPPEIVLVDGAAPLLDELERRGLRLGILSDGPAASQAAEAEALGLARWFDPIVLTGALGEGFGKPATPGFSRIAEAWALRSDSLAYVADNPEKDFAGPRALGWHTVRVRRPGQLRAHLEHETEMHAPDIEITELAQLLDWLDARSG